MAVVKQSKTIIQMLVLIKSSYLIFFNLVVFNSCLHKSTKGKRTNKLIFHKASIWVLSHKFFSF